MAKKKDIERALSRAIAGVNKILHDNKDESVDFNEKVALTLIEIADLKQSLKLMYTVRAYMKKADKADARLKQICASAVTLNLLVEKGVTTIGGFITAGATILIEEWMEKGKIPPQHHLTLIASSGGIRQKN
jgi:hypothetical protein